MIYLQINRSGKPRKFDKNQSRKSDDGQQQGIRNSTDFQGSKFPEKKKVKIKLLLVFLL